MANTPPAGDPSNSGEPANQPPPQRPRDADSAASAGTGTPAWPRTIGLSRNPAPQRRGDLPAPQPLGESRTHLEALLADRRRGVVGFSDNAEPVFRDGAPTGEFEVVVFTRTRRHAPLPKTIGGYPVRAIVSGQPRKLQAAAGGAPGRSPLMGGDSIGTVSSDGTQISVGTIGCFVQDGAGKAYALTCAHIFGSGWAKGDSVCSPVPPDDPTSPVVVGTLYDACLNNTVDAALVSLTWPALARIRGVSLASGPIAPNLQTPVAKYGCVSRRTEGQLTFISTTQEFNDDGNVSQMSGLIAVHVPKGLFALEGDSGAAVVDIDVDKQTDVPTNKITGIVVGNAYNDPHDGSYTFVCGIDQILSAFTVTLQLVDAGVALTAAVAPDAG